MFTGRVGHRVCLQSGPDCVAVHDQILRQWRQRGERADDGFTAATAVGGTGEDDRTNATRDNITKRNTECIL